MSKILLPAVALFMAVSPLAFADDNGSMWNNEMQGVYIAGQAGMGFPTDNYDDSGSYAGALGYQFSPNVRTELEFSYRNNDLDIGGGDVSTSALMLNAFYDFKNDTRFTPYVGGGIGMARSSVDSVVGDDSDHAFAYQLGGGVSYAMTPNFALTADYRWFDTSSFDYTIAGVSTSEDYSSHEVRAGVRYTF